MVSHCACSTRVFLDRALHEHRRPSSLPSHVRPVHSLILSQGWGLIELPLRASNEGLLRPRIARAQKIDQLPSHACASRPTFHALFGKDKGIGSP